MRLTRRHLLTRLLPRTLAGALAGTAVASCTAPGPPIVMSAGESGGIYVEFANQTGRYDEVAAYLRSKEAKRLKHRTS